MHVNHLHGALRRTFCIVAMDFEDRSLQVSRAVATLPDGTYDVIVVDAETTDDGELRLELTVTLGPHIGRLVVLRGHHEQGARGGLGDAVEWLGIPGTLHVGQGEMRFRPERP
jgi:hypothetical protein